MRKNETEIDRFIDKKCFNAMYTALSCFIEDNPSDLELSKSSNTVESPDGATLVDMEIIKTENCVIDEDMISFDTIVSCELEIEETVKRNRETDGATQWFNVHCTAVLEETLKKFTIAGIEVYCN